MTLVRGVGFAILMLFSMSSKAAEPVWLTYVIPSGEGALSISDQPCTVRVALEKWALMRSRVMRMSNVDIGEPKQSRLLWKGQVYAGCYVIGPDNGRVYNYDSEGDPLVPPPALTEFVPHEGALPAPGSKGTSA